MIPTGWDKELVLKTVFKSGTDKVCLVSAYKKKSHSYSKSDKLTQKFNNYLITELSKFTKVETLEVNYIDLKDIVIQVNKYIKGHPEDEFTINIATGSHMIAATLMFVAFMNNIDVEYTIAKGHHPKFVEIAEKGEDLHYGFSEILKVPTIPCEPKFSHKEESFLKKLKEKGVLTVAEFVKGAKGDVENRLRSEFHYISKKLEKRGIVKVRTFKNKVEAKLTHFGEIVINS
jgi:hypothetical protein